MIRRQRAGTPRRVFLHIGLPKTGTTYLQQLLWNSRETLARDGIFMPGFGHREHLWAALEVTGRTNLAKRHPDAPGAWQRLVEQSMSQSRDVLITHEFFCGAKPRQAAAAVAAFGDAEVHLVVTARDSAGVVSAGWAESVKNGGTASLTDVLDGAKAGDAEFSMRTWNLLGVLRRWGRHVPPERVHVLPMPGREEPRETHWRNFAGVLGIDADAYAAPETTSNPALGVVQIELLRRVNAHLPRMSAHDRGTWIRGYLAEEALSRQGGSRGGLPPGAAERFAALDEEIVEFVQRRGFHVVGDVSRLRGSGPEGLGREPVSVSEAELLESAAQLVAVMVADVRDARAGAAPGTRGNR